MCHYHPCHATPHTANKCTIWTTSRLLPWKHAAVLRWELCIAAGYLWKRLCCDASSHQSAALLKCGDIIIVAEVVGRMWREARLLPRKLGNVCNKLFCHFLCYHVKKPGPWVLFDHIIGLIWLQKLGGLLVMAGIQAVRWTFTQKSRVCVSLTPQAVLFSFAIKCSFHTWLWWCIKSITVVWPPCIMGTTPLFCMNLGLQ